MDTFFFFGKPTRALTCSATSRLMASASCSCSSSSPLVWGRACSSSEETRGDVAVGRQNPPRSAQQQQKQPSALLLEPSFSVSKLPQLHQEAKVLLRVRGTRWDNLALHKSSAALRGNIPGKHKFFYGAVISRSTPRSCWIYPECIRALGAGHWL